MKNENDNETEINNNLNEISNEIKKNPFFKEGLFIEIPEDDSSINNEGCFSKKGSYLENISINTPCDRFLSKSLIKKIEEGTPVENIKIDLEKLKISDELFFFFAAMIILVFLCAFELGQISIKVKTFLLRKQNHRKHQNQQ